MNYTYLPNGVKYLEIPMTSVETVTIMVMAKSGSKYETATQSGIAHFMEHMFFKGGKKYKNSKDVSLAFDNLGGIHNAWTGKELVAYYATVSKKFLPQAIDILSDMLLHASFPNKEVEKEKGVILAELKMYEDEPREVLEENLEKLMYGSNGLGRSIIGNTKTINSFKQKDFLEYKKQHYTNNNLMIVIAGNTKGFKPMDLVKNKFKFNYKTNNIRNIPEFQYGTKKELSINKKTQQAHIALAYPSIGAEDKKVHIQEVLTTILGRGMSSRLFQNIREKLGVCYYIYASPASYLNKGYLGIYAGLNKDKKKSTIEAIRKEIKNIKSKLVSPAELQKAKNILNGGKAFIPESTSKMASFYGSRWILLDDTSNVSNDIKKTDKVTTKEIRDFANEIFIDNELRYCEVI